MQKRSRWQDSLRAAQGAQVRKGTAAFCGEDPLRDPWSHKGVARVEPMWEDGIFLGVSNRSDELYVGRERHAQGSNSQTPRGHRTS